MKQFLYGPVPSRRLGLSLGVDLVPLKTCSYDCVYCQLGKTQEKTIARKPYISAEAVLDQLSEKLGQGMHADYITLAGSGEPTLNSQIGVLIQEIKRLTDIPVAVLTNSSLLGNEEVRRALMEADVALPSLDAYNTEGFEAINRPHPEIRFEAMVEGLIAFGEAFTGQIWLEVFVLKDMNATKTDAAEFKPWIAKINPKKIHVNTSVRPPAEVSAKQASPEALAGFCEILGEKAEVVAAFRGSKTYAATSDLEAKMLNLIARRPCTLDDMASGLGAHKNEILKHIDLLLKNKSMQIVKKNTDVYYQKGPGKP